MNKMLSKVRSHVHRSYPTYIGLGMLAGLHVGWKALQDAGIGDKGRDYPHKKIPEFTLEMGSILVAKIKSSFSDSSKDKSDKDR